MDARVTVAIYGVVALLALSAHGCGGGGETAIRSGDDAARYIDDVVHGASVNEFKAAEGATPVARAAIEDSAQLSAFQRAVREAPEQTCDVATLVSTAGDVSPESVFPVVLETPDRMNIYYQAESAGIPDDLTTRVLTAAIDMAQSTWVEAVDKACGVVEGL